MLEELAREAEPWEKYGIKMEVWLRTRSCRPMCKFLGFILRVIENNELFLWYRTVL